MSQWTRIDASRTTKPQNHKNTKTTGKHLRRGGKVDSQDHRSAKTTRAFAEWTRRTTDPQKPHEHDRTRRPEPKTTRDQKPQNDPHKNHKTTHTRTTKDPQRPKTSKTACRAGFTMIRSTKTTKTTKTTWACGSSRACGYLGGYSLYFYIILYIYKSKCECECE